MLSHVNLHELFYHKVKLFHIKNNKLIKELDIDAKAVHDNLSKLLAFSKQELRHAPNEQMKEMVRSQFTDSSRCLHCCQSMVEDYKEGHLVCTSCGITGAKVMAVPFETVNPFTLPLNKKRHYLLSSKMSAESDKRHRLKSRIETLMNVNINFDIDAVLNLLSSYKEECKEISNSCIVAAIFLTSYRSEVEQFKVYPPPPPFSCSQCLAKFHRKIDWHITDAMNDL